MRARSLLPIAVVLVTTWAGDAAAQTKNADPCAFVTRKSAARCLGTLLVGTISADDAVTLDGHGVGKGSVVLHNVPGGKHVIAVRKPDGAEISQAIVLARGGAAVVKIPGAALTGPSAPPISQSTEGVFDECDGTYLPTRGGTRFPLRPDDLGELRKKPGLAAHLPTETAMLALPEAACRRGEAAACREAAHAWERTIGKRESNVAKAHGFYEEGCKLGDVGACVAFGTGLANGYAGAPDLPKARDVFTKACARDDAEGCRRLGDAIAFPRAPVTPATAAAGLPFMSRACELGDREGCRFATILQLHVSCARGDHEACELAGIRPSP